MIRAFSPRFLFDSIPGATLGAFPRSMKTSFGAKENPGRALLLACFSDTAGTKHGQVRPSLAAQRSKPKSSSCRAVPWWRSWEKRLGTAALQDAVATERAPLVFGVSRWLRRRSYQGVFFCNLNASSTLES